MLRKAKFPESVAAIDLGSNSFHMVVAKVSSNGELRVVDRLKEMVRLAGGLDAENRLSAESQERAIHCLRRFGERIQGFPRTAVRAVGTNTLRKAKNAGSFLNRVDQALGYPVEIIAGREEARLVYLGVMHSLGSGDERRLVVDIGGGSTELIIGHGYTPHLTESLYMGCVSMSAKWFENGRITAGNWGKAITTARLELEPLVDTYQRMGWDYAVGASGTIKAAERCIKGLGLDSTITLQGLHALRDQMIRGGELDKLKLPGVSQARLPVFPGGIVVLQAVFEALDIERMESTAGALREGVLNDLVGRMQHEDVRFRVVNDFAKRYHVDLAHAERVAKTAMNFFPQVSDAWELEESDEGYLNWAAWLHEIGLDVAHSEYHKHGAYLLEYADLPGFSRQDQLILSALVRTHRKKISWRLFENITEPLRIRIIRLATLLRLAVVIHRSRTSGIMPDELSLQAKDRTLTLALPGNWLEKHPLIKADLENEQVLLRGVKFKLILN